MLINLDPEISRIGESSQLGETEVAELRVIGKNR